MEDNRMAWIDVLKGIGIILVVIGHTHVLFHDYIFSFHMPLFFFISGYLYTNKNYKIHEFIIKKARTILVPYIFFVFLSIIIAFLISNEESNIVTVLREAIISTRNRISINQVLWFLTTLFIVELLFYIISTLVKNYFIRVVIIIVLSCAGYLSLNNPMLPFSMDISLYYLLFYFTGNIFRKLNITERKNEFNVLSCLCLFIGLFFIAYPSKFGIVTSVFSKAIWINYIYSIIMALIGIIGCFKLSLILEKSEILAYYGKNTLVIFALHIFILNGLYYLLISFGLNVNQGYNIFGIFATVFCLLLIVPIINFFNKYLPKCIGKI